MKRLERNWEYSPENLAGSKILRIFGIAVEKHVYTVVNWIITAKIIIFDLRTLAAYHNANDLKGRSLDFITAEKEQLEEEMKNNMEKLRSLNSS
ncbi:MAG: hypothetical protein ACFFD4_36970 [Candidatus Odinarchaeota archaeon]